MKKLGSNQRPPRKGNSQRRNNANTSRNGQKQNNSSFSQNGNSGNGRKSHTPHLWSSASSSTPLTSHLSMTSRRNPNGTNKNIKGKNGLEKSNDKLRGKAHSDQNEKNRNSFKGRSKKKRYSNQSNTGHQNRTLSDSRNCPTETTQQIQPENSTKLESKTNNFNIDPFELFCAYHLGISPTNQYRSSNINEVANRFNLDAGTIRQILKKYEMDSASLLDRDFDMAMAQLDIQVAPEGVNRTELARNIFEDFLKAPIKKRDWGKILDEDRKENAKTFNRR